MKGALAAAAAAFVVTSSAASLFPAPSSAFTYVPSPSTTRLKHGHKKRRGVGFGGAPALAAPSRAASPAHPSAFRSSSPRSLSIISKSSVESSNDGGAGGGCDDACDVLVLGSGPAARALATLLSAHASGNDGPQASPPADVIVADANYDRSWSPNYGAWLDEWESIRSLYASFGAPLDDDCVDRLWTSTDCFFGGSFDMPATERTEIDRSYVRVDRHALRRTLSPDEGNDEEKAAGTYRVLRANHASRATGINVHSPAGTILHDDSGSIVRLQKGGDGDDYMTVRAKVVVDCTGHETKLVLRDDRDTSTPPPGYQIAYGVLAEVDELREDIPYNTAKYTGPYDKEAMTLFDYRTDHFAEGSAELARAESAPTFMYAMPLSGNKVFFEETSLVARPAVSFRECKERCMTRLEHLGIRITAVEEEEFCYIPMGGPLPARDQRIVGFGGSAAMVHPSTGYHLCRAMMCAGDVARTIRSDLREGSAFDPDGTAARAYNAIWSPENIAQRNFAVFGGEFLMKQDVRGLRGFFSGFFRLPVEVWGGFLAGWPGLPNNVKHETWYARILFGLTFVSKLPTEVALGMVASIVGYSVERGVPLPQSVTPLLGLPEGYLYDDGGGTGDKIVRGPAGGDAAAKAEARMMITESAVEELVPVSFTTDGDGERADDAPSSPGGGAAVEADKQLM